MGEYQLTHWPRGWGGGLLLSASSIYNRDTVKVKDKIDFDWLNKPIYSHFCTYNASLKSSTEYCYIVYTAQMEVKEVQQAQILRNELNLEVDGPILPDEEDCNKPLVSDDDAPSMLSTIVG
ncbi:hypothetical protein Leryth_009995 [Lithospermum erythrorhizon]|nr:hypothetical protein Leryth_009995 [Lithospermum erythrorhizon]